MPLDPLRPDRPRQVARLPEAQVAKTNALWPLLAPYFDYALTRDSGPNLSDPDRAKLYTTRRMHAHSPSEMTHLRARLPRDIQGIPDDQMGHIEAAFINFLLNSTEHRLLTLIGLRGVGKSSLIRHILVDIREHSKSLQRFIPITLDLLKTTRTPSELDILGALMDAAEGAIPSLNLEHQIEFAFTPDRNLATLRHAAEARYVFGRFAVLLSDAARSAGKELIVVFDNLDQLSSESTTTVLDLARVLTLRHGVAVVVAMRPYSYRAQTEKEPDRGAFVTHPLVVTPPDLIAALTVRLRHALKRGIHGGRPMLVAEPGAIPIDIGPIKRVFKQLLRYFVSVRAQEVIVQCLANYDFRQALSALRSFLRYRDLRVAPVIAELLPPFAGAGASQPDIRPYELLNGIMVGELRYYREDDQGERNTVLNIFDSGARVLNEHALVYRLLGILARGADTKKIWCLDVMRGLGYKERSVTRSLDRLLQFGLVMSPEHEFFSAQAEHFRLTHSGWYYLETLSSDPDYLFNTVFDTPLAHRSWIGDPMRDFAEHMESVIELLRRVIEEEQHSIRALKRDMKRWVPRLLEEAPLLCRQIFSGALSLVGNAARSVHTNLSNFAVEQRRVLTIEIEPAIREAEASLRAAVEHASHSDVPDMCQFEYSLLNGGELTILSPRYLQSRSRGMIEFKVRGRADHDERLRVFCELPDCGVYIADGRQIIELVRKGTEQSGRAMIAAGRKRRPAVKGTAWVLRDNALLCCTKFPP